MGFHVNWIHGLGDSLVKTLSGRNEWPKPIDVALGFTCPESGFAEIIFYVEVNVDLVKKNPFILFIKICFWFLYTFRFPLEWLNMKIGWIQIIFTFYNNDKFQSSNSSEAYVPSGGIGQRKIAISIWAKQTLYFEFKAKIYGY